MIQVWDEMFSQQNKEIQELLKEECFLSVFHFLFNLPLRQTEGFVGGLRRFVPNLEKPDHSTIGRNL